MLCPDMQLDQVYAITLAGEFLLFLKFRGFSLDSCLISESKTIGTKKCTLIQNFKILINVDYKTCIDLKGNRVRSSLGASTHSLKHLRY